MGAGKAPVPFGLGGAAKVGGLAPPPKKEAQGQSAPAQQNSDSGVPIAQGAIMAEQSPPDATGPKSAGDQAKGGPSVPAGSTVSAPTAQPERSPDAKRAKLNEIFNGLEATRTAAAEHFAKAQEDKLRKVADSPGGAEQEASKKQRLDPCPLQG